MDLKLKRNVSSIYFLESVIFIVAQVESDGGVCEKDSTGENDYRNLEAGWHKISGGNVILIFTMSLDTGYSAKPFSFNLPVL